MMMNLKLISMAIVIQLTLYNVLGASLNLTKAKSPVSGSIYNQTTGESFYKNQCAFCHTKEQLIAPDMNKIKAKYLEKFKTKEAFVKAVIAFVKNPNKKNAIYKEGIDNFTDMPKMPFKDDQIKAVAEYIYSASNL